MGFKKLCGVALPEEWQGLIRFTCLTYRGQPGHVQRKISRLCDECGGIYSAALKEVMCSGRSIQAIAQEHHVSESTLYRLRREFYENWDRRLTRSASERDLTKPADNADLETAEAFI